MSKHKGVLLAIIGISLLFVSGCSSQFTQFFPLPDEQRYKYINEMIEEAQPETAGEIIYKEKDKGDGVFSPSSITLVIKGENSYQKLVENIKKIPTVTDCTGIEEVRIDCVKERVTFFVHFEGEGPNQMTSFRVTDSYSGRD